MQLVGGGVKLYDAMKNNTIDRDGVHAKFGVFFPGTCRKTFRPLAGDRRWTTVPGLRPECGIKTAALLIKRIRVIWKPAAGIAERGDRNNPSRTPRP